MSAPDLPDGLILLIKNVTRSAVMACAAPGSTGPQRVEELTGFSAGTISRWQGDAHKELCPIEVMFLIEHITQKPVFARALAAITGHRLVPITDDEPNDEVDVGDLLAVSASSSRFNATLAEALEDGKITPAERKRLHREKTAHLDVMAGIDRKLANVKG